MDLSNNGPQSQEVTVSLFGQILLAATAFGLETSLGFYQVYAVLLYLRYMGVPLYLVSLDGIVTGVFCFGVVPLIGYLTDKGHNPKLRKWLALLFGNGLLLMGILLFALATSLNLEKLIKHQESGAIYLQNLKTQKKLRFTSGEGHVPMYTLEPNSSTTASASNWPTGEREVWEMSVPAVLAILCVSFFNIGYDICASMSRAFLLVCVPTNQQSGILITVTILQSLSGTIFSTMGILDLPRFLGPLFGVDGVSVSFLLFSVYMAVCVVVTFIITTIGSHRIINGVASGHKESSKTQESRVIEQDDLKLNKNKTRSFLAPKSNITSLRYNKEADGNADDSETILILPKENLNSKIAYSSIPRETPIASCADFIATQREQNGSKGDSNETSTQWQIISAHQRADTKLRLNKKLLVLCLSYFFQVGGMLSMVEYMPNALTVGIYHGDPRALPGSEKHALYQKGLKMAALGILLVYASYFMTSLGIKKALKYIDAEMLNTILSSFFLVALIIFVIFRDETFYFLNAIAFGPYRTCIFTTPYLLAARYNQENQVNPEQQAKNIGKVMSLIGILLPIHYFILSTFIGPVMNIINVWFPLYYSLANFFISFLFFCLLLYWKISKKPETPQHQEITNETH